MLESKDIHDSKMIIPYNTCSKTSSVEPPPFSERSGTQASFTSTPLSLALSGNHHDLSRQLPFLSLGLQKIETLLNFSDTRLKYSNIWSWNFRTYFMSSLLNYATEGTSFFSNDSPSLHAWNLHATCHQSMLNFHHKQETLKFDHFNGLISHLKW